jgi:quercetin dioxygenase-like cupin family protein
MVHTQMIRIDSIAAPTPLSGDNTQGIFHLEEITIRPGNTETFEAATGQRTLYLIEGQVKVFSAAKETWQLQSGDILHLPATQPPIHYQNNESTAARILQIFFATGTSPLNYLVKADEGDFLGVITDVGTIKLSTKDTQGAYLLMSWAVPPQSGVPIHAQGDQETFYILDGRFQFEGINQEGTHYELPATSGTVIHVPKRIPHAYKNVGEAAGHMLVLTTPAGRTEEFFRRFGYPVADANAFPTSFILPEPAEMFKLFQEFNIQVFG